MPNEIRRFLRKYTPLSVRRFVHRYLGNGDMEEPGAERDIDWYDQAFSHSAAYNCPYYESQYYFLWCVLVDRLNRAGSKSVLDIGCGPGQVASFLRDKGFQSYFGLDLSPVAINKAKDLCPEFEFLADNALESKIYWEWEYDTVISLEFLEHVQNELAVIEKIRSGALFLGTVPDFPYPSHVRYFTSIDEVKKRYAIYFSEFRVVEFKSPSGSTRYFLIEGIKI